MTDAPMPTTPDSVHHIAFLVRDLDAQVAAMSRLLGTEPEQRGPVPYRDAEVVIFRLSNVRIELVSPNSDGSPLQEVLRRRGEGFFHVGFGVDDLDSALAGLARRGITPRGERRVGYKDWELVYLDTPADALMPCHLIRRDAD